jgi:hypothetical protein
MGSVLVIPFFQRQKVGTWGEANVLTLAVAKVANLGRGKIARAESSWEDRGRIAEIARVDGGRPRSHGPNRRDVWLYKEH